MACLRSANGHAMGISPWPRKGRATAIQWPINDRSPTRIPGFAACQMISICQWPDNGPPLFSHPWAWPPD
eukprot:2545413-Lingulodinium_polyedra.AAC.1